MSDRTYPILAEVIKYFPNHSHIYITATTGGTHATTSYHYRAEAIDVGSASQVYKDQLAAWLYKYSSHITELIHTKSSNRAGWYVKNGVRRGKGYYGGTLERAHINHVHLAVKTAAQARALLAAVRKDAGGSGSTGSTVVRLRPVLASGSRGTPVKLAQTRLNANGIKVAVDGTYGPKTVAAIKAFQKKKGLRVDGWCGAKTWAALG